MVNGIRFEGTKSVHNGLKLRGSISCTEVHPVQERFCDCFLCGARLAFFAKDPWNRESKFTTHSIAGRSGLVT